MSLLELSDADRKILEAVRRFPNNKKTKIAELAGVPWATATASIDKLIENNILVLVRENADFEKNSLHISKNYAYFIGVSIGTSHIKVCVLDFSFGYVRRENNCGNNNLNEIYINDFLPKESIFRSEFWEKNGFNADQEGMARWCADTPDRELIDIKKLINNLCDFALELKSYANVLAIGFSFPGYIDHLNNSIVKSKNLDFNLQNVSMNMLFTSNKLESMNSRGIKICFEHNVKASAIAEKELGVLKNKEGNAAVFYFGAGLGVSFWLNGQLYRGKRNASGQVGNISVFQTRKLEDSIRELFITEQDILENSNSYENRLAIMRKMTAQEMAKILDEDIGTKKQKLVSYLSQAIFNINYLLDLDFVVLSGKLNIVYPTIENEFQEQMIACDQTNIQIIPSAIGEFSAAVGTAIYSYYQCIGNNLD